MSKISHDDDTNDDNIAKAIAMSLVFSENCQA